MAEQQNVQGVLVRRIQGAGRIDENTVAVSFEADDGTPFAVAVPEDQLANLAIAVLTLVPRSDEGAVYPFDAGRWSVAAAGDSLLMTFDLPHRAQISVRLDRSHTEAIRDALAAAAAAKKT